MSASPTYPGRQEQIMVRWGSVFWTLHSAFWPQGASTPHGSRHTSLRHARRLGQSPSMRHSGSGSGTAMRVNCEV